MGTKPTDSEASLANLHSNVLEHIADRKIRLSEIVRVVRRYGIQVVSVSILGAIAAGIWAHFQPPLYDATALVHLDQHSSISLGAISAVGDQYDIKIQTQIIGLESPTVVAATIEKLDLT